MRTAWKAGVVAASLAATCTLVGTAQAGNFVRNLPAETIGIWNAELQLNQWLDCTQANGWVLLDDVTYTINASPCQDTADEVCVFMPARLPQDIPLLETPPQGFGTRLQFFQTIVHGSFLLNQSYTRARYDQHEVFLGDWSAATLVPSTDAEMIDHFAVAWYGELLGLIAERQEYNLGPTLLPPEQVIHPFTAVTANFPLSLAIAAVPMSQSRHYQTPYIVKHQKIHFQNALLGIVNSGTANLKGRVIPFTSGLPALGNATPLFTIGNGQP